MENKACCCSNERHLEENLEKNQEDILEENLKYQRLDGIIQKHKGEKGPLIPILHDAQELFGYLPAPVQERIAAGLNIPLSEVFGVITFYHHFSLEPKGRFNVSVCMGTACYVKGAGDILSRFVEKLGIEVGECTPDGLFSLEECRCLGACGLAPVLTVNEKVYGRLTLDDVDTIIERYRRMANEDAC
ncbi:MAG: NAD(P)H-dependent oxidoreductase subunit E [Clostridiales bacterium]|nr:NAD(P)H-dependent oxidoreductase subunit E [Clostridiales bacterium]